MSQELITKEQAIPPFGSRNNFPAGVNAGAVAIEQERAIAEARGSIQIAQMFPRDIAAARAELMNECDYMEFASVAFYSVPRSGGAVTGPSIRLAESVASAYGHMEWGHRELSRSEDKSEVEVFAWDKQKNNKRTRQITVDHYRDTKSGRHRLRDEKDIQDKIANVSAKQMRGCILAILPKSLTEAAMARCRATLAGGGGVPLVERVNKMVDAFAKIGVTAQLLVDYLQHPLNQTNGDEIVDLTAIYQAIRGGDKISDYFGKKEDEQANDAQAASLAATAKAGAAKAASKPPAKPKPEPKKEPAAQQNPEPIAEPVLEPASEPESNTDESASSTAETNSNAEQALSSNTESTHDAEAYADDNPENSEDGDLF